MNALQDEYVFSDNVLPIRIALNAHPHRFGRGGTTISGSSDRGQTALRSAALVHDLIFAKVTANAADQREEHASRC